jgi:hypothetical protein
MEVTAVRVIFKSKSYDFGQDRKCPLCRPFKLRELADALEGGKIPKTQYRSMWKNPRRVEMLKSLPVGKTAKSPIKPDNGRSEENSFSL